MKRKMIWLLLSLSSMCICTGCQGTMPDSLPFDIEKMAEELADTAQDHTENDSGDETDNDFEKDSDKETHDTSELKENNKDIAKDNDFTDAISVEARNKYAEILDTVYYQHLIPDVNMPNLDIAKDRVWRFAICDIDYDGKEEMVLDLMGETDGGSSISIVYGYDDESQRVYQEIQVTPRIWFYDNGIMLTDEPRSGGWGDRDYSPMVVYQYDSSQDTYNKIDYFWIRNDNSDVFVLDPFPAEMDDDGDGTVYYLHSYDMYVTKAEFDEWYQKTFDGSHEIELPWKEVKLENYEMYLVENNESESATKAEDIEAIDAAKDSEEPESENNSEEAELPEQQILSGQQAYDAVVKYCCTMIPGLRPEGESAELGDKLTYYWWIDEERDDEYVIAFRSYTASITYFYVNKYTGETTSMDYVSGVSDELMPGTDYFNVYDYL